MIWQEKRFDEAAFIRSGRLAVYKAHPLPDTPMMRKALEDAYREKARQNGAK